MKRFTLSIIYVAGHPEHYRGVEIKEEGSATKSLSFDSNNAAGDYQRAVEYIHNYKDSAEIVNDTSVEAYIRELELMLCGVISH